MFEQCNTSRGKAQILYLYLILDDALVRYVVHEYVARLARETPSPLDFSNETLVEILTKLEYSGGNNFDYADSTTERWWEGFRSVMREVGVLKEKTSVVGRSPSVGDIPLLVAMGYSYEAGNDDWITSPKGLHYLLQPEDRWEELYDRAVNTNVWEGIDLHTGVQIQPCDGTYS